MEIKEKIIDFIEKNRVSTTEVADALGKTGALKGVLPIKQNTHIAGSIKCVFTANNSNYALHEQIRDIKEDDVVIVFTHNCEDRAILGDLVSKFILLYKGAKCLVVDGMIRDIGAIKREGFNVWSNGVSPIGCFNVEAEAFPENLKLELLRKYEGAIAVCDDGGVVIIENDLTSETMLTRLERIEMQEDIWFFCLDTLKWDTKKIVCDKAYLHETNLLAAAHLSNLDELGKPLDKE